MKIVSVVGARPNFMKIAPFIEAIAAHNIELPKEDPQHIEHILVHTGQHYDYRMSQSFFEALGIPRADINLEIGSGSHAKQVGETMIAFEKVLQDIQPDWVVVVGDVNATLACSVTAKKEKLKVCHIEAGLRSGDIEMPEEINRLVTDRLSDLLLTPDRISNSNLEKEGVAPQQIAFVGNVMIDTLRANLEKAQNLVLDQVISKNLIPQTNSTSQLPIEARSFALMTLHRPSNVDDPIILRDIMTFLLEEVITKLPLLWPIHPRTKQRLIDIQLWDTICQTPNLLLLEPLPYHDMLCLNNQARLMLTDSGGLQEECTVLGTPCLTLRWNTERPITLREHGGLSEIVGNNIGNIRAALERALDQPNTPHIPENWDGQTAPRMVQAILDFESAQAS